MQIWNDNVQYHLHLHLHNFALLQTNVCASDILKTIRINILIDLNIFMAETNVSKIKLL